MKPKAKRVYQKKKQRKFKHTKPSANLIPPKETNHSQQNEKPQEKETVVKKTSKTKLKISLPKIHLKQKKEKGASPKQKNSFQLWLTRHDSDVQLILFPLILLVILVILSVFNNQVFLSVSKEQLPGNDQFAALHPYPYVQAVNQPDISAKAGIILDRASQVILYSKNPQIRFSMASTTKIMTALVALNYYKQDDILTIKHSIMPDGLNLSPDQKFHFIDLLFAMLLPSANDAAQAIADNYPGGEAAFVRQMNNTAQSLHLINTHYADPIGLDDDGDYSTVVDMARLSSYAIANPIFVDVTSTKYKTIYTANFSRSYPLTNLNKLLGIDGVTGIKTGTTEGAGEVLVTSTVKNGHTYIIVVMDSTDRFYDTSLLLNFIDANVKYVIPTPPAQ